MFYMIVTKCAVHGVLPHINAPTRLGTSTEYSSTIILSKKHLGNKHACACTSTRCTRVLVLEYVRVLVLEYTCTRVHVYEYCNVAV